MCGQAARRTGQWQRLRQTLRRAAHREEMCMLEEEVEGRRVGARLTFSFLPRFSFFHISISFLHVYLSSIAPSVLKISLTVFFLLPQIFGKVASPPSGCGRYCCGFRCPSAGRLHHLGDVQPAPNSRTSLMVSTTQVGGHNFLKNCFLDMDIS